jgi:LysR family glycine cleavage system transcriptional activator
MRRRRLPPLNSLHAFEVAARYLSLSRAAEELCVTHGAVSRQVAKLEMALGAKLFIRRHQQLTLTAEGAAYAARLQSLFDQIQEATAACFDTSTNQDPLRVAVLPTFSIRLLVPKLARFKEKFPQITLEVETSYAPPDPNSSDVDVAVWLGDGNWPNLISRHLFDEELVPVGSPHLVADRSFRDADDLKPFLLLRALHRLDDWEQWLNAVSWKNVDGYRSLRLEYSGLVYQGALDGLGLAMAQPAFVHDDLQHGRLKPLSDFRLKTERAYFTVYSPAKAKVAKIVAFCDWLDSEVTELTADYAATRQAPRRLA